MSVRVYFSFSTGLSKTLLVPPGTTEQYVAAVAAVEETLNIKRSQDNDNPVHWDHWDPEFRNNFPSVSDKELCETAERHNTWVRRVYDEIDKWAKEPVEGGEELTPEAAQRFWPGLRMIEVSPERWSSDYYRARMEALYEVMRGRETEGISFGQRALTPKQAGAVIRLFEGFLDPTDLRLEVPKDRDYLASSYDGEYDWCERCGAIAADDFGLCRRRKCPLREESDDG